MPPPKSSTHKTKRRNGRPPVRFHKRFAIATAAVCATTYVACASTPDGVAVLTNSLCNAIARRLGKKKSYLFQGAIDGVKSIGNTVGGTIGSTLLGGAQEDAKQSNDLANDESDEQDFHAQQQEYFQQQDFHQQQLEQMAESGIHGGALMEQMFGNELHGGYPTPDTPTVIFSESRSLKNSGTVGLDQLHTGGELLQSNFQNSNSKSSSQNSNSKSSNSNSGSASKYNSSSKYDSRGSNSNSRKETADDDSDDEVQKRLSMIRTLKFRQMDEEETNKEIKRWDAEQKTRKWERKNKISNLESQGKTLEDASQNAKNGLNNGSMFQKAIGSVGSVFYKASDYLPTHLQNAERVGNDFVSKKKKDDDYTIEIDFLMKDDGDKGGDSGDEVMKDVTMKDEGNQSNPQRRENAGRIQENENVEENVKPFSMLEKSAQSSQNQDNSSQIQDNYIRASQMEGNQEKGNQMQENNQVQKNQLHQDDQMQEKNQT